MSYSYEVNRMKPNLIKVNTIASIRAQIERGELLMARDRLYGLVANYNDNLEVRNLLGDVYWQLGDQVQAGAMWYFVPTLDEKMKQAIQQFEDYCDNDPCKKWRLLKVRKQPSKWDNKEAANILKDLENQLIKQGSIFSWNADGSLIKPSKPPPKRNYNSKLGSILFLPILAFLLWSLVFGAVMSVKFLLGLCLQFFGV